MEGETETGFEHGLSQEYARLSEAVRLFVVGKGGLLTQPG